jgi:hypothetical protein
MQDRETDTEVTSLHERLPDAATTKAVKVKIQYLTESVKFQIPARVVFLPRRGYSSRP